MSQRKPEKRGKTRTREHVIGDLAVNAVERRVLLCGYTLELVRRDYGYDASIVTFNEVGEMKPGWLYVQIKATDHPKRLQADGSLAFRVERADLATWLNEQVPVILCVYDVAADVVYYLHVQRYFEAQPDFDLFAMGESTTVYLARTQALTPEVVKRLGDELDQQQGLIREARGHD